MTTTTSHHDGEETAQPGETAGKDAATPPVEAAGAPPGGGLQAATGERYPASPGAAPDAVELVAPRTTGAYPRGAEDGGAPGTHPFEALRAGGPGDGHGEDGARPHAVTAEAAAPAPSAAGPAPLPAAAPAALLGDGTPQAGTASAATSPVDVPPAGPSAAAIADTGDPFGGDAAPAAAVAVYAVAAADDEPAGAAADETADRARPEPSAGAGDGTGPLPGPVEEAVALLAGAVPATTEGEADGATPPPEAADAGSLLTAGPTGTAGATSADGDWAFADHAAALGARGAEALAPVGPAPSLPGDAPWEFGASAAARRPLIVGEATHEIPVHLLFRDETEPAVRRPTVVGRRRGTGEQPRVRRATLPTRPVPQPDPKFTERPGPALPGWVAAFTGLLALVGCAAVLWWKGAVPEALVRTARLTPQPYHGIPIGQWLLLTLGVIILLLTFGGLSRGRSGHALVLSLFGEYRGTVRRTGLLWISPLLLRRRVDTRLRHWRSEPMPAVDAHGTALRVVVLVVWRVRDTVRATLGIRDHEEFLREQVEAAMARVMSQLPADAFHETAPTLRNAEVVGDSLTRMLSVECRAAGLEVFSAQPTRIEYAPEIAEAMQRSRIAALDARHRDTVLTAVVDAVDDTVHRLTSRGLVELDDYERKALVKDLTVAFYTGRAGGGERY